MNATLALFETCALGHPIFRIRIADNVTARNAVVVTTAITVLSYFSGGMGLGAASTTSSGTLTLVAAIVSLAVGAIAGEGSEALCEGALVGKGRDS